MAEFPDYSSIPYVNPLVISMNFKTLISNFDRYGEEKRKRKWLFPKRSVTLSYRYISRANARTIWQFYQARSGAYEAFNFFTMYADEAYVNEYVGIGDGSTTVFNLPSKNGSSRTVYIDGVAQADPADYSFTAEGGADSADKVEFVAAPNDGEKITYDFAGVLKIRCRFKEDSLSYEQLYNRLNNIGITLEGLLNE